jgi:hypothetical protein
VKVTEVAKDKSRFYGHFRDPKNVRNHRIFSNLDGFCIWHWEFDNTLDFVDSSYWVAVKKAA